MPNIIRFKEEIIGAALLRGHCLYDAYYPYSYDIFDITDPKKISVNLEYKFAEDYFLCTRYLPDIHISAKYAFWNSNRLKHICHRYHLHLHKEWNPLGPVPLG